MERLFKKTLISLNNIFDFINDFMYINHIDHEIGRAVMLAVEEIYTNLVKHNKKSANDISIDLSIEDKKLTITLIDFDVEHFDITEAIEPDSRQTIQEQPTGGMGLQLVRETMDKIYYEYENNNSKIILIKKLD